ncbi:MAG: diaminopimelate decarboxylase [Terracidiphilus sp.]
MTLLSNPHLNYRAGTLFCEDISLPSLAARYGTPLYVYSRQTLLENYRRLAGHLTHISSLVCYSVKANSNLAILNLLRKEGAGFDIVSGGELVRVLKTGADARRIVFSGVGKTQGEIDAALGAGILMFNVESAGELDLIATRARERHCRAPIAVRVNPDVEAETHPYISTGQTIHKFGIPKDEALSFYRKAAGSPDLEILGVACHIGSQILDVDPFLKAFDEIWGLAQTLNSRGASLRYLDIGGGFGIRYADETPLQFESLAKQLEARLSGAPWRLVLEPGRSVVGNTGLLLTRVLYVKRGLTKNFIIVDSAMNDLVRPALYGSFHQIVPVAEPSQGRAFRADVVGPICETGDFLAQDRELPEAQPGDLLAVLGAGAYGYALASNYNTRPRPAEVLVEGDQARIISRRETLDDLMSRESLSDTPS